MVKTDMKKSGLLPKLSVSIALVLGTSGVSGYAVRNSLPTAPTDSTTQKEKPKKKRELQKLTYSIEKANAVNVDDKEKQPLLSVQQWLKGVKGVFVQEPSGEPGTKQSMLLRGTTVPLVSSTSYMDAQPAVYLNGVPVADDRAYSYLIKNNSRTAPGTMSNIMASLDMSNIERIEVVSNPFKLAKLGPTAANGAIWITTRDGFDKGPHVSVDANVSVATPPRSVKMTGAADEVAFRSRFYPKGDYKQFLPAYLDINQSPNLFASTRWADDYFNTGIAYNINATIGNRQGMANYLFTLGSTRSAGVADATSYSKYNIGVFINMMPYDGLSVNLAIQAAKSQRSRNRNILDRLSETEYLPDLSTPLVPTGSNYDAYRIHMDEGDDANDNTLIHGVLRLSYEWENLFAHADVDLDYDTNTRHAFWPKALMGNVNYVSDYSGYNRRFYGTAGLGYKVHFGKHQAKVEWEGILREDKYHYTYDRGYNGEDDKKQSTNGGGYKQFRYLDRETAHLASSAFHLDYSYDGYVNLGLVLRQDGTSDMGRQAHWIFTPGASVEWNLEKTFSLCQVFNKLNAHLSYARVGKYLTSDIYGLGTQYNSNNISWMNSMVVGSYNGLATITRPYSTGWLGRYNEWPYSDKFEFGLDGSALGSRLSWNITLYKNNDKNLIVAMPAEKESGYNYVFRQGMEIENRGIELGLSVVPVRNSDWHWTVSANMTHNVNELKKLPGGASETMVGDRLLKVGEAVDRFYLLENHGIDAQRNPIWSDSKVLTGHILPGLYGGLDTKLSYKQFDLSLDFHYALGQKAMNYRAYRKYDFATIDDSKTLDVVSEVFFWRSDNLPADYPIYDITGGRDPYRFDQDLYLEDASYLKMRSVSLGYRFKSVSKKASFYVYGTVSNLFTLTGFSGDDPELVDFDGVYRGYGQPLPRTYTLGVKVTF